MPLKILLIRQHTESISPVRRIDFGDLHRIEIRADHPRARRGFLDLRDQIQRPGVFSRLPMRHRVKKIAGTAKRFNFFLQ